MSDLFILFVIAINALLGVAIYLRNSRLSANRYFAAFVAVLSVWILFNYLENTPDIVGLSALDFFLRGDFAAAPLFFYFWYRFASVFSESKLESRSFAWFRRAVLCAVLCASVLPFVSEWLIYGIYYADDVIRFSAGVLWIPYAALLAGLMIGGAYLLLQGRQEAKRKLFTLRVHQIDLILAGSAISLGLGLLVNLLQALTPISLETSRMGLYGMTIFVLFTAYAMVRARFFEMRLAIMRALGSLVLVALIAIVYATSLFFIARSIFHIPIDSRLLVSAVIVVIILLFSFHPIKKSLLELTEKVFLSKAYNYHKATILLLDIINRNIDPDMLSGEATRALQHILNASHVELLKKDHPESNKGTLRTIPTPCLNHLVEKHPEERVIVLGACALQCKILCQDDHQCLFPALDEQQVVGSPAELAVPIYFNTRMLGVILLGVKRNGEPYTEEDCALLESFSAQFAMALEKAELYGKVRKHSLELEQKVEERTKELASLRDAEHAMFVEISHGLQTPLTVLKSEVEFLRRSLGDEVRLSTFETSVDMVSSFIYDLLKLSRLESEHDEIAHSRVDLSQLLGELVEYASVTCDAEQIVIVDEISPNVHVRGDRAKLREAIINLLSNSIKYIGDEMPKEIRITLSARGSEAKIVVADSGLGISKDDLPHIFKRFYRANKAFLVKKTGSGLGLPITRAIIEKHGGSIEVDQNLPRGTVFTVRLRAC